MSVPITCPHCGRRAKLKSAAALGRKKPCPGCGEVFTLKADAPEDEFGDELADDGYPPAAAPPPRRASSQSPGHSSKAPAGKRRRKKSAGGSNRMWWVGGGLAVGVLMCGGCFVALAVQATKEAVETNVARQEAARTAVDTPPAAVVAATEDQARALGEAFARAMNQSDRNRMAGLLDADALIGLSISGFDLTEKDRADVIRGFKSSRRGITDQWVTAVEGGGSARFLGVIEQDGAPAAMVRLLPSAGGVSYLALYPTPDGNVADTYVFTSGERLSATLRRLLGAGLGGSKAEQEGVASLARMQAAIQRGDGRTALNIYDGLPGSLQGSRGVQVLRVTAAGALNDPDRYQEVLADVDRRFPDDPSLDLLKVDYYASDSEKLVATLERLDRSVDGDPHLRGLLAEHLPDVGRPEDALAIANEAVEEEPDLMQAQIGLLSGTIAVGDFEAAADALRTLRDEHDLGFDPPVLADLYPRAREFVDSPAYAAFRAESPFGR